MQLKPQTWKWKASLKVCIVSEAVGSEPSWLRFFRLLGRGLSAAPHRLMKSRAACQDKVPPSGWTCSNKPDANLSPLGVLILKWSCSSSFALKSLIYKFSRSSDACVKARKKLSFSVFFMLWFIGRSVPLYFCPGGIFDLFQDDLMHRHLSLSSNLLPSQSGWMLAREPIARPRSKGKRSAARLHGRGSRCIDRRRKEVQDAGCVMSFPTGKTELAGKCFSGSKTLPALKIKL